MRIWTAPREELNSTSPQNSTGPGDINKDSIVDFQDLIIVLNDFRRTSNFANPNSDTNADSIVNLYDVVPVTKNWGTQY